MTLFRVAWKNAENSFLWSAKSSQLLYRFNRSAARVCREFRRNERPAIIAARTAAIHVRACSQEAAPTLPGVPSQRVKNASSQLSTRNYGQLTLCAQDDSRPLRLTNAFVWFNFIRPHKAPDKRTPAMAAPADNGGACGNDRRELVRAGSGAVQKASGSDFKLRHYSVSLSCACFARKKSRRCRRLKV